MTKMHLKQNVPLLWALIIGWTVDFLGIGHHIWSNAEQDAFQKGNET